MKLTRDDVLIIKAALHGRLNPAESPWVVETVLGPRRVQVGRSQILAVRGIFRKLDDCAIAAEKSSATEIEPSFTTDERLLISEAFAVVDSWSISPSPDADSLPAEQYVATMEKFIPWDRIELAPGRNNILIVRPVIDEKTEAPDPQPQT